MALYPSLEDMKVDQLLKAQMKSEHHESSLMDQTYNTNQSIITPSAPRLSTLRGDDYSTRYPALNDYMGLELTQQVIAANMPEYLDQSRNLQMTSDYSVQCTNKLSGLIAPLSSESLGLHRALVTNGIRELILCKDADGKVGVKLQSVNKGVFVNLVIKNSPAAMAGIRFGDQILEVNGKSLAGLSINSVREIIKKSPVNDISLIIRDRPFERTVTLHKDSTGHVGFSLKDGKIIGLVVDSSAAKNGLLTDHNILEVNGQNVVGMKDKEIIKIISEGSDVITVTLIPSYIYQHITKSMPTSLLKSLMDHSIPTF